MEAPTFLRRNADKIEKGFFIAWVGKVFRQSAVSDGNQTIRDREKFIGLERHIVNDGDPFDLNMLGHPD